MSIYIKMQFSNVLEGKLKDVLDMMQRKFIIAIEGLSDEEMKGLTKEKIRIEKSKDLFIYPPGFGLEITYLKDVTHYSFQKIKGIIFSYRSGYFRHNYIFEDEKRKLLLTHDGDIEVLNKDENTKQ